ncbi:hypothetical protein V5F01_00620 [Streptomyces sp. NRRL B-2790]|uniref:hypothetical protein n=1 Tax=Streptomyces sp. NRRL B-2790 TaxID=1463835 RepID=UPI00356A7B1B
MAGVVEGGTFTADDDASLGRQAGEVVVEAMSGQGDGGVVLDDIGPARVEGAELVGGGPGEVGPPVVGAVVAREGADGVAEFLQDHAAAGL